MGSDKLGYQPGKKCMSILDAMDPQSDVVHHVSNPLYIGTL